MADHGHDHDDDYYVHSHISTIKTNTIVLGALLFFTFLTVLAYNVRLGDLNLTVAVLIAMIKATIVGTWFMHLKYEKKFNILFFAGSLIFVAIFLGYTMNDTAHRGRQGSITGLRVDPGTGSRAYGTDPLLRSDGEFTAIPEAHDGHEAHDEAHDSEHSDSEGEHEMVDPAQVEGEGDDEDGIEGEGEADIEGEGELEAEEPVEVQPTMDPAPAAMTTMTAMTAMTTTMTATMAAPAAMAPAAMAPAAMAPAAMAPAAMAPAAMTATMTDGE